MNSKYLQSMDGLIALAVFAVIFTVAYYALKDNSIEAFVDNEDLLNVMTNDDLNATNRISNTLSGPVFSSPKNLRIDKIYDDSVDISFDTPEVSASSGNVKSYKIIIVKYDNPDRSNPSEHYIIHSFNPDSDKCVDNTGRDTMNCSRNIKLSKETDGGDTIYYRIGLMAIYNNGTSSIIGHNNVPTFRLGVSVMKHLAILKNAEKEENEDSINLSNIETSADNENVVATADGRFEYVKRQLGGYPDNLFLDEHTGPNSLSELIKRQLSLGILNGKAHFETDI
jgi:hypothetical protein